MLKVSMKGDWKRAALTLLNLQKGIKPAFEAILDESGELVLKTLKGHIYSQDLCWTPLSSKTIEFKGGDSTIYIETGEFVESGLIAKKLTDSKGRYTLYVGASDATHNSAGVSMNTLFMWLEFGTDRMPARPLLRPTIPEVEKDVQKIFSKAIIDLIQKAGKR